MKEIKLYGAISNEGFLGMGENGYIERIANEIKSAQGEEILLKINTPGGNVFDGYAIISNLLEHDGKVNMQVDGYAASMGGAILAYADNATAFDFAKVMLHKVYSLSNSEETVSLVDKLNTDFADMFKAKGVDPELIDEIFLSDSNKDYWFSAQEAKDAGLIDEVLVSSKVQKAAAYVDDLINKYYLFTNQKKEVIMNPFKNSKEALRALQDKYDELVATQAELPTREEIFAMAREEVDKITEEVNRANEQQAQATMEEQAAGEDEIKLSLNKITESVEQLAEIVGEIQADLAKTNAKIDNTINAIQGVVTDFTVPETVEASQPEIQIGSPVANAQLNKKINEINAERKI